MKICIYYDSITGNTKKIADAIYETCKDEVLYCGKPQKLQEADLYFGPCLRQKKNALFYEKWQRQLQIHQNILTSLDEDHPRFQEVCHIISMIEGEINES